MERWLHLLRLTTPVCFIPPYFYLEEICPDTSTRGLEDGCIIQEEGRTTSINYALTSTDYGPRPITLSKHGFLPFIPFLSAFHFFGAHLNRLLSPTHHTFYKLFIECKKFTPKKFLSYNIMQTNAE